MKIPLNSFVMVSCTEDFIRVQEIAFVQGFHWESGNPIRQNMPFKKTAIIFYHDKSMLCAHSEHKANQNRIKIQLHDLLFLNTEKVNTNGFNTDEIKKLLIKIDKLERENKRYAKFFKNLGDVIKTSGVRLAETNEGDNA